MNPQNLNSGVRTRFLALVLGYDVMVALGNLDPSVQVQILISHREIKMSNTQLKYKYIFSN